MEKSSLPDLVPSSWSDGPWVGLSWAIIATALFGLLVQYTVFNSEGDLPVHFTVPIPEPCKPGWEGKVLERPTVKVSGTSAIQCYCPANGRLLGQVNPATPDGIDRAIAKAWEAQAEWAKTTWGQRRKVLRTMLSYILTNQETIARAACLDSGKTKIDASFGEILVTAEKLKWTIQHGEKALVPERRPTNFLMVYKYNEVKWEPLGVVAACVSWNYPVSPHITLVNCSANHDYEQFHNLMGPIISTIFTGSAIIVKSSERTAWSMKYFSSIARAALAACGHSPELVQAIVCWPQTANHLTSHPEVSHITFIGSRPVAHAVCASAAKALIPVCVELGGKDPAIILDDVKNVDKVASILMRGVFQSAGQNCVGIERIIALPTAYSKLVQMLEPRIRNLRVGSALDDEDDVDVGALISSESFDRLETLIADAVTEGAKLLVGASEELFAPVCILMRASSVTDAIKIANDTPYALGASVFGTSRQDLDSVVDGVKAGMVSVNDFAVYYAVQLPFGGVGGSGYGRFAGEEGLRSICNTKSVCRDRWPSLVGTSIPKALDYPIKSGRKGWEVCKGVVALGYGEGMGERMKGLWKIVRNG